MQRPSRRTIVTLGAIGIMTAGLEAVLGVTRRTRAANHDRFQNEALSLSLLHRRERYISRKSDREPTIST